jgi:hypothetical protein
MQKYLNQCDECDSFVDGYCKNSSCVFRQDDYIFLYDEDEAKKCIREYIPKMKGDIYC